MLQAMRHISRSRCLDVLFGTAFMPSDRVPTRFGLDEPVPTNYFEQLAYPFGLDDRVGRLWHRLRTLVPKLRSSPTCVQPQIQARHHD